jgi:hypothetical protein
MSKRKSKKSKRLGFGSNTSKSIIKSNNNTNNDVKMRIRTNEKNRIDNGIRNFLVNATQATVNKRIGIVSKELDVMKDYVRDMYEKMMGDISNYDFKQIQDMVSEYMVLIKDSQYEIDMLELFPYGPLMPKSQMGVAEYGIVKPAVASKALLTPSVRGRAYGSNVANIEYVMPPKPKQVVMSRITPPRRIR